MGIVTVYLAYTISQLPVQSLPLCKLESTCISEGPTVDQTFLPNNSDVLTS